MLVQLDINDLIDYTQWDRDKWHALLRRQDAALLTIETGPHGDGRFRTIGDVIRHIFSAEKRYIERLIDRPLTDTSVVPADSLDALFQLGDESRYELRRFVETYPASKWNAPLQFQLMGWSLTATPRKVIVHILMHELRHWAQIATMLRLHGITDDSHDFLFSPVLGGALAKA